jgi:hypothetical protein
MVEFVVVFLPVMTLFLCTVELARLAIAQLMVERAAGMAVRACAVIKDQPENCDETGPAGVASAGSEADRLVRQAAAEGLRPWTNTNVLLDAVECKTQTPNGQDTLQLRARFQCVVPIARAIICTGSANASASAAGASRAIHATARYAHQGASYNCEYAHMELPGGGELELPALGGGWP